MVLFDYVFYRLNKFYFKWDGTNGSTSIIGVTSIQSILLIDLIVISARIIMGKENFKSSILVFEIIFVVLFVIFCIYNFLRYKDKYDFYKSKWEDETWSEQTIKGILVVLFLALPWIIIISFIKFS